MLFIFFSRCSLPLQPNPDRAVNNIIKQAALIVNNVITVKAVKVVLWNVITVCKKDPCMVLKARPFYCIEDDNQPNNCCNVEAATVNVTYLQDFASFFRNKNIIKTTALRLQNLATQLTLVMIILNVDSPYSYGHLLRCCRELEE